MKRLLPFLLMAVAGTASAQQVEAPATVACKQMLSASLSRELDGLTLTRLLQDENAHLKAELEKLKKADDKKKP